MKEVVKLLLFIIIWAMPIVTSILWQDKWLLALFLLSIFVSSSIFNHYESIESSINIDDYLNTGKIKDETKNTINNFIDFLFNNLITLDDEKVNFWKNIKIK